MDLESVYEYNSMSTEIDPLLVKHVQEPQSQKGRPGYIYLNDPRFSGYRLTNTRIPLWSAWRPDCTW
jgi:hypothetical protein